MKSLILITGGTGYIGSHTAVELIESGFDVVIADNLSNSRRDVINGIAKITGKTPSFEKINFCDRKKTQMLFKKYPNIKGVIHFAAFKAVGESYEKPVEYYYNNITALANVLEEMKENKVQNLIFSSSCTVYGHPEKLPVTEQSPIKKALSPYGNTKRINEEMIIDSINAKTKINAISLRYFNPIGAHDSAHIGELPIGIPLNLVPFITQTAAGIRKEVKIFGDTYDTPDGTCVRDYIHVEDLAKAHVCAMKRLIQKRNKKKFEVFNLGVGEGFSVIELIRKFEEVTGEKIKYKIVERRKGDIDKIWADASLAKKELKWSTKYSIEKALSSAWKWENKHRGLL